MKFLADQMLGKLAKWLRYLGYDTLYPPTMDDDKLVKICRVQHRILLTRDRNLANSTNKHYDLPGVYYIESDNPDLQLSQIIQDLNLKFDDSVLTRCGECNDRIIEVNKEQVEGKVPKGVYDRQDKFWWCKNCKRYYWRGSHYDQILAKIELLKNDVL
jgi:uncharacterized protein with PIN domain